MDSSNLLLGLCAAGSGVVLHGDVLIGGARLGGAWLSQVLRGIVWRGFYNLQVRGGVLCCDVEPGLARLGVVRHGRVMSGCAL